MGNIVNEIFEMKDRLKDDFLLNHHILKNIFSFDKNSFLIVILYYFLLKNKTL